MNSLNQKSTFINQKLIITLLLGVILGIIIFASIRLYKYSQPEHTHYHANFQVWINGVREEFVSPLYYQEVASCLKDDDNNPKHRAHMHNQINDVVHVHASAVTWGQFFENINIGAQPNYLRIGDQIYTNNDNQNVKYILNGKELSSLNGVMINSEDTMLVNYGSENVADLLAKQNNITNKAKVYNTQKDPASCSSNEKPDFSERLQHILN